MTPEEYIKAYTRGNSNELVYGIYHDWLTPEDALAAVELARKEMKEPASEDLEEKLPTSNSLTEEGLFTFKDGSQAIITEIG